MTHDPTTPTLSPCRHCKGEASIESDDFLTWIRCEACGARTGDYQFTEEAAAAWEQGLTDPPPARRAPPAAAPPEIEEALRAERIRLAEHLRAYSHHCFWLPDVDFVSNMPRDQALVDGVLRRAADSILSENRRADWEKKYGLKRNEKGEYPADAIERIRAINEGGR